MPGTATLNEIAEQFDVWKGLVDDIDLLIKDVELNFQAREYDDVVFVGAGSSWHAATAAASSFRSVTGEMAFSLPSSEVCYFHRNNLKKERKYIFVFISRSGRTPETEQALDVVRKNYRASTVAISCDPASPLCSECDMAFPVKNCVEESVTMTKSFTSMLMVTHMFAAALGERYASVNHLEQLPEEGKAAFEMQRRVADKLLDECSIDRTSVLGGGPFLGVARECALKIEEMALARTEAMPPMEFLHGPRAAADAASLIAIMMSDSGRDAEMKILKAAKRLGAKTLVMSDKKEKDFDDSADYSILTGRGMPELYRGMLYAPFMQYLGAKAALAKGLDPDNPPNISRVASL
jgi:glucosamine--fructose-6-phosphate aminotransferase (isomerizing)